MEDKKDFIQKAITNGWKIIFNYVTADFQVKYGKQVMPKEIRYNYLYAEDTLDENKIKRYLLDGIQALSADVDGQVIQFLEEYQR